MSERAALYRLYDATDVPLYIGITRNPDARFGQHAIKPWWPEVARRELTWFDTWHEAHAAEMKAIQEENPRHNKERYGPPEPSKGRKVSLWLPDDLRAAWKATGLPLSKIIDRGLDEVERQKTDPVLTIRHSVLMGIIRQELAPFDIKRREEPAPDGMLF